MALSRVWLIAGLVMGLSGAAEAGWLGTRSKQPKAVNLLTRSPAWTPSHLGPATRGGKYAKPGWGAQWKQQLLKNHPYRAHAYIRGY
jgi:hypothetical protein